MDCSLVATYPAEYWCVSQADVARKQTLWYTFSLVVGCSMAKQHACVSRTETHTHTHRQGQRLSHSCMLFYWMVCLFFFPFLCCFCLFFSFVLFVLFLFSLQLIFSYYVTFVTGIKQTLSGFGFRLTVVLIKSFDWMCFLSFYFICRPQFHLFQSEG